VAWARPILIGTPFLGKSISILKDTCQRADSHSVHWTLSQLSPYASSLSFWRKLSVFNSLIRISIALQCGIRIAPSGLRKENLLEGNHMRRLLPCLSTIILVVLPLITDVASASDQTKDDDRLRNCGTVLKEILDVPDNIPQDLLDKADCVVVFPSVLKAAFIVGGSYGRGAMSCRRGEDFRGPWGAPTMMALEGGSFGFQIGGQATDFVLLVMNESGARGILASKVKLGGDASVAAGPVGRDASADTDATLRSEILSYSRARGLFAGVSLEGSTIRPDNGDNRRVYGRKIPAREIVLSGTVAVPPAAEQMTSTLDARTPKHRP
jgi:lipid-binding SYLF domain-containing protein